MKTTEEINARINSCIEDIKFHERMIEKVQEDIVRLANNGIFEFGCEQRTIELYNTNIDILKAQIIALKWVLND